MLVQQGILPLPLSNSKITKTKKIYNFISFLCNSYISSVKRQYRPCFGFSWRVQQSSIVIPTYTILCSNTIHKYPPSLCFLIISPCPSCALSLQLNRSLHAYKDKQWHQLRCQSAKCSFLLPRLQWALSLWSVSNFVSRASLLPSFVFFFACPSSSRSCISSLISNEQVYSFNFPTNMPRFQVCTTSGGAGTRGLGSRVTLINSRPLPGMTNFPGAVTKKYDAPFVSPSGSCDRLANHRAAGLNLPNFSTKQKALQSRKQTQPCCLTGRDYTEVLSAYNYK